MDTPRGKRPLLFTLAGFVLVSSASCAGAKLGAGPEGAEGPTLSMPHEVGSGEPQPGKAAPPKAQAKEPDSPPRRGRVGSPPDPEPLREALQYEYVFYWNRGSISVESTKSRRFSSPVVTARRMGRFAVELWIGRELVERVRFDFPLLAADSPGQEEGRLGAAPGLGAGARVRQTVLVPASSRATRALLVDRATGEELVLPWPPEPSQVPASVPSGQGPGPSVADPAGTGAER